MFAIFWLSVIKTPRLYDSGNWFWDNIDKPGHCIAYAVLAGCMLWAFARIIAPNKGAMSIKIGLLFVAFVYSLFLEIVQYFLPYRSFDPWDLLANAIGICLAALIFFRFNRNQL